MDTINQGNQSNQSNTVEINMEFIRWFATNYEVPLGEALRKIKETKPDDIMTYMTYFTNELYIPMKEKETLYPCEECHADCFNIDYNNSGHEVHYPAWCNECRNKPQKKASGAYMYSR